MIEPSFTLSEEKKDDKYARLVITPLVAGYGHTMGTALRRVLLTSLPGAAVTSVKIAGVKHQFSTLKGMREDVLDFLLNLKKARFIYEGEKPAKASLLVSKAGEVKARDISVPAGVEVANPELVLANLSKGAKLDVSLEIESGVGYTDATEQEQEEIGLIPLDASFSPVQRVNYRVEETRVGRVTNYDKLILEVWTDGTLSPKDAVTKAAEVLVSYFDQVVNPRKVKKKGKEESVRDSLGPVGALSVEEISLPTRVANALARAGYETVAKLAAASREDLSQVRNLGEKSIDTVREALREKGVEVKDA